MSHVDLWMARHGEVAEPWRDRLYGDLDVPLSSRGRMQSAALARQLAGVPLSTVVSSGLERAEFAAAELRAPRGLARRDERDLREIGRGAWAGLTRSEIAARNPELWRDHVALAGAHGAPEGESPRDLAKRVLPALDRLAQEPGAEVIAVVCHRWVVAVVVCHALGLPYERAGSLALPHASLVHLRWPTARIDGGVGPELVAFALARAGDGPDEPTAPGSLRG